VWSCRGSVAEKNREGNRYAQETWTDLEDSLLEKTWPLQLNVYGTVIMVKPWSSEAPRAGTFMETRVYFDLGRTCRTAPAGGIATTEGAIYSPAT
jgi:hypothetical protein